MQIIVAQKENNIGDDDNDEIKKVVKPGDIKKGDREEFKYIKDNNDQS